MDCVVPSLVPFVELMHCGSLDPRDKGRMGESYEGHGLSVSVHPDEWSEIADLMGDGEPWACDARDLRLVDGHALVSQFGASLLSWGLRHGWVSECAAWRVDYVDAETEDDRYFLVGSLDEAEAEAAEVSGDIREVAGHAPSAALCTRMLWHPRRTARPAVAIAQDLATVWAEDAGYDGIWWDDDLDVAALSAPRGVLFPHALADVVWSRGNETRVAESDIDVLTRSAAGARHRGAPRL